MDAELIYVQIPAYRDRELRKTLLDLYAKASRPECLRVHVLWQHGDELLGEAASLPNLTVTAVPYDQSKGCNWARSLLQQAWHGEPYTLLLDSHHRFSRNWDLMLRSMYDGLLRRGFGRPLLTAYLPSYDPDRDPGARKKRPYKIYPLGREQGLLTRLTSFPIPNWRRLQHPVPADYLSLHFVFAAGSFNHEIQFDPEIYFFGDEVATSVRAFTAGYDLFHPHCVVGWHCYDRGSRTAHWQDHSSWYLQHAHSLALLEQLYTGRYQGAYGLGRVRTVADYENRIMIPLLEA